jgi:ferredoxin
MTLKITVDQQACQGYACCMMVAPTVFDLDEEAGKAIVITPEVGDDMQDLVEKSVRGCPAKAILVEAV